MFALRFFLQVNIVCAIIVKEELGISYPIAGWKVHSALIDIIYTLVLSSVVNLAYILVDMRAKNEILPNDPPPSLPVFYYNNTFLLKRNIQIFLIYLSIINMCTYTIYIFI